LISSRGSHQMIESFGFFNTVAFNKNHPAFSSISLFENSFPPQM